MNSQYQQIKWMHKNKFIEFDVFNTSLVFFEKIVDYNFDFLM